MSKMKYSGVEWIGEIPQEWDNSKFKYIYDVKKAKLPDELEPEKNNDLFPYLSMEYIRDNSLKPYYSKNGTFCNTNELLLLWDGSNAGEIIYDHPEGFASSTCAILNLKGNINELYSSYYMKFLELKLRENTYGMGIPHVDTKYLNNLLYLIPNLNEQKLIANFLEEKISNLNKILFDLNKQIEILNNYRKSMITEIVTKGLNKKVEFKKSNVDYIGIIPEKWCCKKLKYVLSTNLIYGANESGEEFNELYPRYIRITDIDENNMLKDEGKLSLSPEIAKNYLLNENDILFARSGATVGKTFLYKHDYGEAAFAGYLIKASINDEIAESRYVYYSTLGIGYENWKNSIFTQATIQNIGADKYSVYIIPLPPLEEQKEIVNYLDKKCEQIDKIVEEKQKEIKKMEEYKKSVIYEYVTGKKRVEGAEELYG